MGTYKGEHGWQRLEDGMGGQRRSLQERIRERQQSGFIGRQGQLVQYRENFGLSVDDERRQFLFNIHGDAGVGKTFLTRQLRQIAVRTGALTAYIDETSDDPTAAMVTIAAEFSRAGGKLGDFEKRLAEYEQQRHELESDPDAPEGFASFLTKTAVTISVAAARDFPVAGSLLAPIDPAAAADRVNQAREYIARKFSDHRAARLLLSPADELTPVFVAGLNRVTAGRTIALFFDTYERTAPFLDRWLRDLYSGRYGDLPESLITTVSGQKPLDPNLWGEYLPVIADIPLEPFSEAEARQFLASKNITDETTVQVILTLSGRLPLWVATLAEVRPAGRSEIGDPSGAAVERFLKWEDDPTRKRIAITAALSRVVNQDVLAAVTTPDTAREQFDWLRRLPFVSVRGESWTYHDVVRFAMLRLRRAEAPAEWRSQHNLLAQANANWASIAAQGAASSEWNIPDWVNYTREETYHLLCADPAGNLPKALSRAASAAWISTTRACQWAALIADAGRDANNVPLRGRGQRLLDVIQEDDLAPYLTEIINSGKLDEGTMAFVLGERAKWHRLTGRFDEAVVDLNRAIELNPGNAWAIGYRRLTYSDMKCYDEALADLNRATELDPISWPTFLRGPVNLLAGRFQEALADLDRDTDLDPPAASWLIASRGMACVLAGRSEEALADLNHAMELGRTEAWMAGFRGEAYSKLGRHEEALADLNHAIELGPENGRALIVRGVTHFRTKRHDEAIADFTRVIELGAASNLAPLAVARSVVCLHAGRYDEALADLDWAAELGFTELLAICTRAEVYKAARRYDEAMAEVDRAIEADPHSTWAFRLRGQVHEAVGRHDEALADLNHAIELDPDNVLAIYVRGMTYVKADRYKEAAADFTRFAEFGILPDPNLPAYLGGLGSLLAGRYDEALPDLTRVIESNPANDPLIPFSHLIAFRGLAYHEIGRDDEALVDFNHAIELDPAYASAYAGRGQVYKTTGRLDEALADFNHAIELDPDDDEYRSERSEVLLLMSRNENGSPDPSGS